MENEVKYPDIPPHDITYLGGWGDTSFYGYGNGRYRTERYGPLVRAVDRESTGEGPSCVNYSVSAWTQVGWEHVAQIPAKALEEDDPEAAVRYAARLIG